MKHFITTALLALSCAGVQAQSLTNIEESGHISGRAAQLNIIPQELSYNKQTSICAVRHQQIQDTYDESIFFDVYDDSFNKLKTISPLLNQFPVKEITKRRGEVPVKDSEGIDGSKFYFEIDVFTVEQVQKCFDYIGSLSVESGWLYETAELNSGDGIREKVETDEYINFYIMPQSSYSSYRYYYDYDVSQYNYPTKFFQYSKSDKYLYYVKREYSKDVNGNVAISDESKYRVTWHTEEYITEEQARAKVIEESGEILKTETVGDEIHYYLSGTGNYYMYDTYQYNYPKYYYIYSVTGQQLYKAYIRYKITYTGEWTESTEEYSKSYSNYVTIKYNTAQGLVDACLTQTFFNDDEKYEYLALNYELYQNPPQEKDRDGDGEIDEIVISEDYAIKGLKIMNEDGETLSSINFDENFEMSDYYWSGQFIDIMLVNGKKYISVPGYLYPDENRDYKSRVSVRAIYSVDSSNSGIRKVMTTKGLRVSPTIADRSQTITVELEDDSGKSHEVRVVNAAGQTVKQAVIPAGQRSIKLNAAELGQGMNIVNVNGKQGGNCKIIIK